LVSFWIFPKKLDYGLGKKIIIFTKLIQSPMKKTVIVVVGLILLVGVGIVIFRSDDSQNAENNTNSAQNSNNLMGAVTMSNDATSEQLAKLAEQPIVTVETTLGIYKIKLYTTVAPELTKNFIELAKAGYYDGLTFHRIIPGFVVQGGDPLGNGTGGHSYKGEGNGLADEPGALALKHVRGAVAWAKSSLPNSIGSQFYVALGNLTQLDGGYSVFGQVVEGMDVVDKIAAVQTDAADRPVTPVKMNQVTVSE
jgi:cyclophilin family peptidyl-prolyl cis-trans isomerase